jgi:hypothetical protein
MRIREKGVTQVSLAEYDQMVKALRRTEPINRSVCPFCHGDGGAVSVSRMPILLIRHKRHPNRESDVLLIFDGRYHPTRCRSYPSESPLGRGGIYSGTPDWQGRFGPACEDIQYFGVVTGLRGKSPGVARPRAIGATVPARLCPLEIGICSYGRMMGAG